MPYSLKTKALIAIPLSISLLIAVVLAVSYLAAFLLHLPPSLGFPIIIRILGVLTLLTGLAVMASVFKLRRPVDVLVSTYVTFTKIRRHTPLSEPLERTEKLTIAGPYRYSRHPLYLGVLMLWVAFWLITDYTFLALATFLFLAWFSLVITPLEEKELMAMFGEQYTSYKRKVPRIIPFTRLRR